MSSSLCGLKICAPASSTHSTLGYLDLEADNFHSLSLQNNWGKGGLLHIGGRAILNRPGGAQSLP